jgi:hypothetical protein
MKGINTLPTIITISWLLIDGLYTNVGPGQIITGINAKYLNVWRFWKNESGKSKHQMLIFNPTDKTINVSIKQKVYESHGSWFREKLEAKKKLAGPWNLKPYDYVIASVPHKPEGQKLAFMEFLENEKTVGLLDFGDDSPKNLNPNYYSILSCERLNSGYSGFWAEYGEFIKAGGDSITIRLHFKYDAKYYHDGKSGKYIVKLYRNKEAILLNASFVNKTGKIKREKDEIEIIIPYHRDSNNDCILQLSYLLPKVTRNTLLSITGQLYYYGKSAQEKGIKMNDLDKLGSIAISIPVLIKKM